MFSNPSQGYFIQLGGAPEGGRHSCPGHRFGGLGPSDWRCPRCAEPLVVLLDLDTNDPRLNLNEIPTPALPLMTCPDCFQEYLHYSVNDSGDRFSVREQNRDQGRRESDLELVKEKSQSCLLHAIPDRIVEVRQLAREGRLAEAGDWVKRFDWGRLQHQVGGSPQLVSHPRKLPDCFLCGEPMPFFAGVVVLVRSRVQFEESELQILFFFCRGCRAVTAAPDLPAQDYS